MFRWRALAAVAALGAVLAGCGVQGEDAPGHGQGGRLHVSAAFYPLQFVAQRVGGDRVDVANLTKPGAEPHDLELAPRDVARLSDSDLVLYLAGFQPAVDDAVDANPGTHALDVADAARLQPAADEGHEGAQAEHAGHGDDAAGNLDPHFWLDPLRLAAVGDAVAQRLAELDPAGKRDYEAGAAGLRTDLTALDAEFRQGLAHCRTTTLVTNHGAFGYLAERYGLTQVSISGMNPDTEPAPRQLAQIAQLVRSRGVTTVYAEVLVSPVVAETVAREAGATTAVLDPVEGITDASQGRDYLQVMRADLATLRAGQSCS
jgi:zinc transport system substrate-binding protein